jgi:uncharacterized protein with beta-barrel porin domain
MTNVVCPGGAAAARRPGTLRFRNGLLGTVAAGALSLAFGGPALAGPDLCTPSGGGAIETCSGNQSAGIASGTDFTAPPVTTLNVNNLTTAITPGNGIAGISFSSAGDITLTSNTGAFGITTANAYGIYANASGNLMVTSTGNITTTGNPAAGIYAVGSIAVTVNSTGNLTTGATGIRAIGAGNGGAATIVTSTGNITTTNNRGFGIYASNRVGTGAVSVTSIGNIATAGNGAYGIVAIGNSGAASVTSTGNITTAGISASGILASGGLAATVISTGNITTASAGAIGIYAVDRGTGGVTVSSTGNISTALATGIYALNSGSGPVTVNSTGNLTTGGTGIRANGAGNGSAATIVTSTGNITTTSNSAFGIYASSLAGTGAVSVTSSGNITTAGDNANGVFGSSSGAVTVISTGNITTAGNGSFGIYAGSNGGPIAVTINSGTVSGGSGIGAGVGLIGGTDNTLTNMGTVMALSGLAIQGDTGNNTVNNFGTVTGNVTLGTGTNAFNNMAGGFFNAGATVQLGAGNVLTNAGTISPGGTGVVQTTTLTGNLVQTATGRLVTDIGIAGNTSDRINVSGTASLAGGVRILVSNVTLAPWQQTVLSAAGGATNSGLALLASPALEAQLIFPNATDVVVKSTGVNFAVPGLGANQTALGNALNGVAQASGIGGAVFNLLLNTTSLPGYNLALTQLSGETATGSQQTTFGAMNGFMGVMTDPFANGRGDGGTAGASAPTGYASTQTTGAARDAYAMFTKAPPAVVPLEQRWSVWAAGFGGSQSTDGNAAMGSSNTTSSIAGTAVGADYRFSPFTIAGFALAGGGTSFNVGGSGGGRSDLFQAGAYFRHDAGAAYISGALAYGWQDITTNRTVTIAGTDMLRAEFNANAFSGRLEGGYRFVAPWVGGVGITPYAAGQFTTFDLPAYAETALAGSGAFALNYAAKSVTDPRSELGLRTDKSFAMVDGVLTLRGRLGWAHDYDNNRAIGATFQSLPGASFVVNGAAQASDSALVTASVDKKWLNGWSAAATFEGEFSDVTRSYAGKGVVRYQW